MNAPMSERNKSYPNREQPKVNGLATFVTGVEGLRQHLISAERLEIPALPQTKPRDHRRSNNARAKLPARTYNPAPHSPATQATTQSTFHKTRHGYQDDCTRGIATTRIS